MKKICYLIIFLMIFNILCFPKAIALEDEKDMVYVSNNEREAIYQATQSESFMLRLHGTQIVKESITPIYSVDVLDFAKTNNFSLKLLYEDYYNNTITRGDVGNAYIAKTVLPDNTYGGSVWFNVQKDGVAKMAFFWPSNALQSDFPNHRFKASSSYADHANRIKQILRREEFVPVNDVKYLSLSRIGQFFYIDTDGHQYLIPIGYQITDDNADDFYEVDTYLTISDIEKLAQDELKRYNSYIAEKEAWEKEHPGEIYEVLGYGGGSPVISGCSHVDNILNISEYLGIDMNAKQQDAPAPQSKHPQTWIWATIAVCVIFSGIVAVVAVAMAKKHKKQNTATEK